MAVQINGRPGVWGSANLSISGTATIDATKATFTDYDWEHSAEETPLKDANGEDAGIAFFNATKTITITFVPWDSGGAVATAKTNLITLLGYAPGSTYIDIDDSDGTTPIESANSGHYVVRRARLRRTNTSFAVVTIEAFQNQAYNLATAST